MKGFIEVTENNSESKDLISVNSILRVLDTNPVLLITTELVSNYDGNSNHQIYLEESYNQIKELIKQAQ